MYVKFPYRYEFIKNLVHERNENTKEIKKNRESLPNRRSHRFLWGMMKGKKTQISDLRKKYQQMKRKLAMQQL
jgi:hypothetical protein